MYLRRINVNLYQDIKVLTHYCSTIGKPISGLDRLSRVSGHDGGRTQRTWLRQAGNGHTAYASLRHFVHKL